MDGMTINHIVRDSGGPQPSSLRLRLDAVGPGDLMTGPGGPGKPAGDVLWVYQWDNIIYKG